MNKRHTGTTLTPRQREWLDRVRSVRSCSSQRAASIKLGCNPDTLRGWIRFFSDDMSWPPKIPKRFDTMRISAPPGYRWSMAVSNVAEADAAQLRADIAAWQEHTGYGLEALVGAAKLTMARLETLVGGGDISDTGARDLRKALRGSKIWTVRGADDADIHRRREEVAKGREEREMGLLVEEQRKYGLKRVGVPLSRMIA